MAFRERDLQFNTASTVWTTARVQDGWSQHWCETQAARQKLGRSLLTLRFPGCLLFGWTLNMHMGVQGAGRAWVRSPKEPGYSAIKS